MNTFKIIRRSLWGSIAAACLVIIGVYLALWQTFLTNDGLAHIVKESRIADTVREEILLPKVLQTTRGSDYATLLDDKTVTDAFNTAVSTSALESKLQPAVNSMQKWLNSEEPSVTFTIDMSRLSDDFAGTLADNVNKKIAALPACTVQNTLTQAKNGTCKSRLVTADALSTQIEDMIKNDKTLAENTTLTQESLVLSPSVQRAGSDLPSYLNLLYAVSIVAVGVLILVTLWLLFKHRAGGIITLGSGAILAGIGLFIISTVATHLATSFSPDSQLQQIARAGAVAFETVLHQQALWLVIGGVITVIVGIVLALLLKRRSNSHQTMHLSNS